MKLRRLQPLQDQHVNVTPLIDVVMCLIIFFMICGKLAQDETVKGITLPHAALGRQLTDQQNRLVLNLVPVAGGQPEIQIRGLTVPYESLSTLLKQQSAANHDLKVIIRADESTPYQYIAPVLVSCAEANIRSVNFSTTR